MRNNYTDPTGTMLKRYIYLAVVIAMTLQFAGCGGGGGGGGGGGQGSTGGTTTASPVTTVKSSYRITEDTYGMQSATYLSAARIQNAIVLRTAIAASLTDQDFRTVYRIDVERPDQITMGTNFNLGNDATGLSPFPGNVYFFNGHQSTLLRTVSGSIVFTSFGVQSGDMINGSFTAQVEDGNSRTIPKATYTIKSDFSFVVDTNGAIMPATSPIPVTAFTSYDSNCASCHALGSHDQSFNGAGDISLRGGDLTRLYAPGLPGHKGVTLSADGIRDLKILLNAN
jgi:hypothetical protein